MKITKTKKKITGAKRAFNVTALTAAVLFAAFACRGDVQTTRYVVKTDKINGGGARLVLVTDLHSEKQKNLIKIIEGQKPDLILLGGDIFDSRAAFDGAREFLTGISEIAPFYYVTGNHEYWGGKIELIREEIISRGGNVLSDEYVEIEINGNKIILAGAEDPSRGGYADYDRAEVTKKAFGDLRGRGEYKILLSHRPENADDYSEYRFDLILSGHAHGGQVRIPFLIKNGLYAPNQGVFPKYTGGLYERGETVQIVCRGAAKRHPFLPRVFNRPETVTVIIEK
ncbi:MAG: metallophosphoesterase [Oscillospiraceae bacterium]|jgi:predicted MPP superfamily phosphohydrolase|nr:metallophosphoesterase [Oscillospiraceae bacterium]